MIHALRFFDQSIYILPAQQRAHTLLATVSETHRSEFFSSYGIDADTVSLDDFAQPAPAHGRKRSTAVSMARPTGVQVRASPFARRHGVFFLLTDSRLELFVRPPGRSFRPPSQPVAAVAAAAAAASTVSVQNAVHEATAALHAKLDRSMRQAGKMSVLLAEMEGKYVDRQCRLVDAIDQVHTLEAECLGHRIKADMWQKELDLLKRRM